MTKLPLEIRQRFFDFVCDGISARAFEEWVYENSELETAIGPDAHLELISANYKTTVGVWEAQMLVKSLLGSEQSDAVALYRTEIVVKRVLAGEIGLLTGLRKLMAMHGSGYDFIPSIIRGLESELDCVPEENQYHQWEPNALAKQIATLEFYKPRIIAELEAFLAELRRQRSAAQ